jgi:hypothetical protein
MGRNQEAAKKNLSAFGNPSSIRILIRYNAKELRKVMWVIPEGTRFFLFYCPVECQAIPLGSRKEKKLRALCVSSEAGGES